MKRRVAALWVSLIMILSFIVIVVEIPQFAKAGTWTVDDDGPADFSKIQDAINASSDGDTVFVYNGTYYEYLMINKTINLTGENRATTLINGKAGEDVINVAANLVNITGFTLNGSVSGWATINLENVNNCSVINNDIYSDSGYGLLLSSSANDTLKSNNFYENGIIIFGDRLSHFNSHNITNDNLVNGEPLLYYIDSSNLVINGISMGQLIIANCSKMQVTNLNINNTDMGMEIAYSNNINITRNNISSNNYYNIYLVSSSNITIIDNDIYNTYYGIYLDISSNNTIKSNYFYGNRRGIYLIYSQYNWVCENRISLTNGYGINLFSSSNYNNITSNDVSRCGWYGIYLSFVSNNTIVNNELYENRIDGLRLHGSYNNTITNNNIYLNEEDGIHFTSSMYNNVSMNNVTSNVENGIYIYTSYNSFFKNNITSSNENGIYIFRGSHNDIVANSIKSSTLDGIHLKYSSNNSIVANSILENQDGIFLDESLDNNIIDNIVSSNDFGIPCSFSSGNNISFNKVFRNKKMGIYLGASPYSTIIGNNFTEDGVAISGIQLSHYNTHIIPDNNLVNGEPLYYYKNNSNIKMDGISAGEVIIANCTNITVSNLQINNTDMGIIVAFSTNITLSGNNISENWYGIDHVYSNENVIKNNIVSNNMDRGMVIHQSENTSIINNNISYNYWIGIYVTYSRNLEIAENDIFANDGIGFYLRSSLNNDIVCNNVISSNSTGIRVESSSNNTLRGNNVILNLIYGIDISSSSDYNLISCNNISLNDHHGIMMDSSSFNKLFRNNITSNWNNGIYFRSSSNNSLTYNYVFSNQGTGITLVISSNNNTIRHTNVSENTGYGLFISASDSNFVFGNIYSNNNGGIGLAYSSNNTIHHNNIIENNNQIYINKSNCFNNEWDDGMGQGNHWSDYTGLDEGSGGRTAGDGVGDTEIPHPFSDQGNGYYQLDNYPLMDPFNLPPFLYPGWNLISVPYIQSNTKFDGVLSSIKGFYDAVQYYNVSDSSDLWKHNHTRKPSYLNDFSNINNTMGFWIHITVPCGVIFEFSGLKPSTNQTILIHQGWNLVGYPSLTNHNRTVGLNNLEYGTQVNAIQWYNSATKSWHFMGPSDNFEVGRGYWVHSKVDALWEVLL